jgi:hypothetical protein
VADCAAIISVKHGQPNDARYVTSARWNLLHSRKYADEPMPVHQIPKSATSTTVAVFPAQKTIPAHFAPSETIPARHDLRPGTLILMNHAYEQPAAHTYKHDALPHAQNWRSAATNRLTYTKSPGANTIKPTNNHVNIFVDITPIASRVPAGSGSDVP